MRMLSRPASFALSISAFANAVVGVFADVLGRPDHHVRAARVCRGSAREEGHETDEEHAEEAFHE